MKMIEGTSENIFRIKTSKYAYVTLLMKGDSYSPGAIACAQSIKMTKTEYEIVCMITEDVSEKVIEELKKVYTRIIVIPYIYYNFSKKKSNKNYAEQLNKWIDVSLTKLNAINLIDYEKIFILDVDLLFFNNIDCVFKHDTPAGVFSHGFFEKINKKDLYGNYKYFIPASFINKNLKNPKSFGVAGNAILIKPDKRVFFKLLELLTEENLTVSLIAGPDEFIWMYLYSNILNIGWYKLPKNYSMTERTIKHYMLFKNNKITAPNLFQYMGSEKPWNIKKGIYSDVDIWWKFYEIYLGEYKNKEVNFCEYCNIIENNFDKKFYLKTNEHYFIENNVIICPRCTELDLYC